MAQGEVEVWTMTSTDPHKRGNVVPETKPDHPVLQPERAYPCVQGVAIGGFAEQGVSDDQRVHTRQMRHGLDQHVLPLPRGYPTEEPDQRGGPPIPARSAGAPLSRPSPM